MLKKAQRPHRLVPVGHCKKRAGSDFKHATPTTPHRKTQLFEIFDPETMSAVIVLAREVAL
ncbi:hypothetical protein L4X63_20470 [Geomonas sp. Red32]|uniref:hypothetical protein n=1 Tax=Geomonas sp. Red32 TaxID=2912856 RepID=UPI00202CE6FF|nr:hypothetical protein [Geomonas sp. Red32]MCM0083961.1 hypothetical protein [Geomonas sp. Red32]